MQYGPNLAFLLRVSGFAEGHLRLKQRTQKVSTDPRQTKMNAKENQQDRTNTSCTE